MCFSLGDSISMEDRERLTLIRASGSRIPVICMTASSRSHYGFADATVCDQGDMVQVIEELLCARVKTDAARSMKGRTSICFRAYARYRCCGPAGPLQDSAEESDEKHSWIRLGPPC